jgi:hypothetical protein
MGSSWLTAQSPREVKECGVLQAEYIYYIYDSRYMDNSDIIANQKVGKERGKSF